MKKHTAKIVMLCIALLLVFPYQAFAYKVVVDAGHGGKDPGAIGINGLKEKNVNLDIAIKLRNELVRQGQEVIMTREDDHFLSLAERVNLADAEHADLFVSIHANSFQPSERGTMVLYYDDAYPQADYPASERMKALTPYSSQLAKRVLDSFVGQAGTIDKGLVPSAVYVARMGSIPSILVETAFLSNSADAAILASEEKRKLMALGIAQGILAFKPPVFVDTVGNWARDSILRMKGKGWIEGTRNRYEPDRALTRAEFLTIMDRMFSFSSLHDVCAAGTAVTDSVYGCASDTAGSAVQKYRDLSGSHWASTVFAKAQKLNVLQGYADGTIRPDQSITRAEVAVLFDRLLHISNRDKKQQVPVYTPFFTDVPLQLWAANSIYELTAKGIINGVTDNRFIPDRFITRSEMAAIMDRYAGY